MDIFRVQLKSKEEVSKWLETAEQDQIAFSISSAEDDLDNLEQEEGDYEKEIDELVYKIQMLYDTLGDIEFSRNQDEEESSYD